MALTAKQERFVQEYLVDLNATQAAARAGYKNAEKGRQLVTNSKVVTDRNLVFNHTAHPQAQAHWCEASKAQNLDKWLRVAEKAVKKYGTD